MLMGEVAVNDYTRGKKELGMKNSGRIFTAVLIVSGSVTSSSLMVVGCNGDNTMPDGGSEGGPDTTTPDSSPDVAHPDGGDASADSSDGEAGNPIPAFMTQESNAFCMRFQTCCNGLDAGGAFNLAQCVSTSVDGWYASNGEVSPEVVARGNVTLNETAATGCLAGLATLTCPDLGSSELLTVTGNCYGAIVGTLANGGDCIQSVECKPGEYCKFAGVDGGTTDAGSPIGQCATLIAQGQPCGQSLPYGDPNEYSTECEYKNWQPPSNFCDYDTYPDAAGYTCQPLRTNGAVCYYSQECASGICGTIDQDCLSTTCTCLTSLDYTPFCTALAIKDAGTD
jgi:hypothetical protein